MTVTASFSPTCQCSVLHNSRMCYYMCISLCRKNIQPLTANCATTNDLKNQPGKKNSFVPVNGGQIQCVQAVPHVGKQHVLSAVNTKRCSGCPASL